jgi:DNA-binding PadR family transcriptional regulator
MGHGGYHYGYGRSSRSSRFFDHGDLRLIILAMLNEQPRHGYELIKAFEERTGGAYTPSPGVVYPTLTMLEEQGLTQAVDSDGGKKSYALTDAGREALERDRATIDAVQARMAQASERSSSSGPRLMRATENLKTALRLKLAQGALTDAQIDTITRAIDDAAGAVEKA